MLKKLILIALFVTSAFAVNPNIDWRVQDNLLIAELDDFDSNENNQDWIGVYKKGQSNDWDNVQVWSWVKEWIDPSHVYDLTINVLSSGDYEARYFKNNSYEVYDSFSFTYDNQQGVPTLDVNSVGSKYVYIKIDSNHGAPEDWVALFKKDAESTWENVIAWFWVNNIDQSNVEVNMHDSPSGDYEVRLFFNNSYDVAASTSFYFSNDNGGGNDSVSVLSVNAANVEFSINSNHNGDEDWVAVYRKGESNDWDNVIAWSYVKDLDKNSASLSLDGVDGGTFELRFFYDNSYNVVTKTEFSFVNNAKSAKEIIIDRINSNVGHYATAWYTPNKELLVVKETGFGYNYLYVYDLSDSEYNSRFTILSSSARSQSISAVKVIDDRTIQYHIHEYHDYYNATITYDIINHERISEVKD